MLNTITSLFKPRGVPHALPPATKHEPVPPTMHLAGRGKDRLDVAHMALGVVRAGGVWTARGLCEHLLGTADKAATDYINTYLNLAWKRGDLARAEVHQRPGQGRPSVVRYAADWRLL